MFGTAPAILPPADMPQHNIKTQAELSVASTEAQLHTRVNLALPSVYFSKWYYKVKTQMGETVPQTWRYNAIQK